MMTRLRDRPTADILVLLIAGTICMGMLSTGLFFTVFAFMHPDTPLEGPARYIADVTNTLVGLLAGFLAGTTTAVLNSKSPKRQVGDGDESQHQEGEQPT